MTDLTIHPRDFHSTETVISGDTDAGRQFIGRLAGGDIPAESITIRASAAARIAEMAAEAGLIVQS